MYTLQMEAASVVVFQFVQCELVTPLVVDGSPTIKSSCSVGLMVSQVVASIAFAVMSWC